MNLKLQNIGIVKNADIKIDGLTVIAGENDTGKSTVGKAIFALLNERENNFSILKKVFKNNNIYENSILELETKNIKYFRKDDSIWSTSSNEKPDAVDVIFIESPIVWNLQEFFNTIVQIESRLSQIGEEISIPYPYLMKDLDFKLHTKKSTITTNNKINEILKSKLINIMQGEFKKNEQSNMYYFQRDNNSFDLLNIATGIKYFGLIQVLLDNNRLNKNIVLVLDEPEVHLHPKWQLKLAELIVYLVKKGVKILVNSHSPYMIEALQRYSQKEQLEDNTNFYLAEDGVIGKMENSNARTLSEIFEKLSEPYDTFEQMESDRF